MKTKYCNFYLKSRMRDRELDWSGSRRKSVARGCERGKEHTGSIICLEIFWLVMRLLAFRGGLCFVEFMNASRCTDSWTWSPWNLFFVFVCLFVTLLYTSLGLQLWGGEKQPSHRCKCPMHPRYRFSVPFLVVTLLYVAIKFNGRGSE
jgi:hypothetical protein